MEQMTVRDIVNAAGGTLLWGDEEAFLDALCIDSRQVKQGTLYIPIIGEKVDGHEYIPQAFLAGAAAVLTSREHCASLPQQAGACIYVADTKKALQDIGAYYRRRLRLPLVGITGSVGKTTTREMIALALTPGFRVFQTPGNSNSQVGVPLTISRITGTDEIGVIEMGISMPGEMERIARVAQVDQAVVTNIGITHIEYLNTKENICRQKLNIQQGMKPGGMLFLNGDDPLLKAALVQPGIRKVTYGTAPDCDYTADHIRLLQGRPVFRAVCRRDGETTTVVLSVYGRHMISNAIAAIAVAKENGVPMTAAAKALETFTGYYGRQNVREVNGILYIDDAYNASPESMKAGLSVLADIPVTGRRVAVLADMKELGDLARPEHEKIGTFIRGLSVDRLFLLGGMAAHIGKAAETAGQRPEVCYANDKTQLYEALSAYLKPGDGVLFKGSNSMGLGAVAGRFIQADQTASV